MTSLITGSIPMDPKRSIVKGLHCRIKLRPNFRPLAPLFTSATAIKRAFGAYVISTKTLSAGSYDFIYAHKSVERSILNLHGYIGYFFKCLIFHYLLTSKLPQA